MGLVFLLGDMSWVMLVVALLFRSVRMLRRRSILRHAIWAKNDQSCTTVVLRAASLLLLLRLCLRRVVRWC